MSFRIGHGYDIHRLEPIAPAGSGRPLILGGIGIAHELGPVAHSDGDALLHAVVDAIMGALGGPDIGSMFPDSAPENAGRDSREFVREAARRMRSSGFELVNLDATVILERPRLQPHKDAIVASIAGALGVDRSRVNVKGKTHERVDATGEGRAVEVHVVALLAERNNPS
jgi:2-C-methyl-D-erythritol 2,4-cyclodiphosphate synthase